MPACTKSRQAPSDQKHGRCSTALGAFQKYRVRGDVGQHQPASFTTASVHTHVKHDKQGRPGFRFIPLDALIPKIPFSFFPDFRAWVTSEAWGSDSVGFWGSCQLSPFWGGGGSGRRALSPPPPRKCIWRGKNRPILVLEKIFGAFGARLHND